MILFKQFLGWVYEGARFALILLFPFVGSILTLWLLGVSFSAAANMTIAFYFMYRLFQIQDKFLELEKTRMENERNTTSSRREFGNSQNTPSE